MHTKELQDRETAARLENGLELVVVSQESSAEATAHLCAKLEDISVAHSTSTDLVLLNIQGMGQDAAKAIRIQTLESRAQSSSLQQKLDQVDASIGAIRSSLQYLSSAQQNLYPHMANYGVKGAVRNILDSIWLLLSSLQLLIRELVYVSNHFCTQPLF